MDFFDSDKLKKGLATISQKAQAAADKAATNAARFGDAAQSGLSKAAEKAQTELSQAARNAQAGAKGLQQRLAGGTALVGAEVSVGGKTVVVDSLLAEGGFGSVYSATTVPLVPTTPGEKVVLKRMFAGVSRAGGLPMSASECLNGTVGGDETERKGQEEEGRERHRRRQVRTVTYRPSAT
jgi:hypothetical protein